MLQVETYIDKSQIDGIGLFANQEILKGTIVWKYNPDIDIELKEFVANEIEFKFIEKYSYYDNQLDKWLLAGDHDRFTNHSETPNTAAIADGTMIASCDIHKGEEITTNYYEIDGNVNTKFKK